MNISKKKQSDKKVNDEQSFQDSYSHSYVNQFQDKGESINYRLTNNYNQIIELLKQRMNLLIYKSEMFKNQHNQKVESLKKAKKYNLQNQAKLLKDQTLSILIQNQDHANARRILVQKISNMDINNFETGERNKLKRHIEKLKQNELRIDSKNKQYLFMLNEIDNMSQKERQQYREIQILQKQIVNILTKKQKDYIKKADNLNDQIESRKNTLRKNKLQKDKKKKEVIEVIKEILLSTKSYVQITQTHHQEIQSLYNGIDGLSSLEQFFKSFQAVIKEQIDKKQNGAAKKAITQPNSLKKILDDYQSIINDLGQFQTEENKIINDIQHQDRKNIRNKILEKIYLNGELPKRNDFNNLVVKCQQYQKLLTSLQNEKAKINKQLSKNIQLNNYLSQQLKFCENEEKRRIQLRKQLQRILNQLDELEKSEKKNRNYQFQMSNLQLQKKNIMMELDQFASKGRISQYKAKDKELFSQIKKYKGKRITQVEVLQISQKKNFVLKQKFQMKNILTSSKRLSMKKGMGIQQLIQVILLSLVNQVNAQI